MAILRYFFGLEPKFLQMSILFETAHHMVSQISDSDFFNRVDCLDKLNNKQNKLENRLGLF